TQKEIEFWNLGRAPQPCDFRFERAFLFWRDGQPEPARAMRIALPLEIVAQKAETTIPVRDRGFLGVLRASQVCLKPLRQSCLEVLGFRFGVLAEDHDVIIRIAAGGDELSGEDGGQLLPTRQGVCDLGPEPFRGLATQRNLSPELRAPPDQI